MIWENIDYPIKEITFSSNSQKNITTLVKNLKHESEKFFNQNPTVKKPEN